MLLAAGSRAWNMRSLARRSADRCAAGIDATATEEDDADTSGPIVVLVWRAETAWTSSGDPDPEEEQTTSMAELTLPGERLAPLLLWDRDRDCGDREGLSATRYSDPPLSLSCWCCCRCSRDAVAAAAALTASIPGANKGGQT